MSDFTEILEDLLMIETDTSVPKNVRIKVKTAMGILIDQQEGNSAIKVSRSLEELGDLAEDPNIPPNTRMQILTAVSRLASQ